MVNILTTVFQIYKHAQNILGFEVQIKNIENPRYLCTFLSIHGPKKNLISPQRLPSLADVHHDINYTAKIKFAIFIL